MPKKSAKQKRLEAIRHPLLLALKKIGPIFPTQEELVDHKIGMREVTRRKTVAPFDSKYREKRRKTNRLAARSRAKNWAK